MTEARDGDGNGRLKVAALGDLHVKEDQDGALPRAVRRDLAKAADVLVLSGDLTDLGKPKEAEILAEDLRACSIPVVGVLGNHDYECGHVDEVREILRGAGVTAPRRPVAARSTASASSASRASSAASAGACSAPSASRRSSHSSQESMNEAMRLENAMRSVRTERSVVVLHYAPIAETVEGEPLEIFPFLGSSRLAETIDRFKVTRWCTATPIAASTRAARRAARRSTTSPARSRSRAGGPTRCSRSDALASPAA